jgi:hypothetical protein
MGSLCRLGLDPRWVLSFIAIPNPSKTQFWPARDVYLRSMHAMPDDGSFNSTDEQHRRGRGSGGVTGRGFQPGRSGCPGGRPRQDVTALARAHTREAIEQRNGCWHGLFRPLQCRDQCLDRGWGKPTQTIEATGDSTVLHLIAAQAISAELLERQPAPPAIEHQAAPADLDAPALE